MGDFVGPMVLESGESFGRGQPMGQGGFRPGGDFGRGQIGEFLGNVLSDIAVSQLKQVGGCQAAEVLGDRAQLPLIHWEWTVKEVVRASGCLQPMATTRWFYSAR